MSRIFGEDDFAVKEELEEKLWELKGYVTRYLRALGIKDDILDDVVQETMVDAWMHMNQLRDVSLMKSWVRTIAKNTGFRYTKKIRRKQMWEFSLEAASESAAFKENEVGLCDELWRHVENMELERLDRLLNCLNEREKNIVLLYYVFQHPFTEVAKIVGESYANTRKISSRAIEKMRKYAAKEDGHGK